MIGNRASITPPLTASRVTPLLWICASTTIAMLVGFALLSRLGLPIELIVYGTLAVLIAGVATVSVTGRTMNSPISSTAESMS